MQRKHWIRSLILALGCSLGVSQIGLTYAQTTKPTGELGSTWTVDRLKNGPKQAKDSPKPKRDAVMAVEAADQPVPALRYRFWPSPRSLRAGNAYLHFSRAVTLSLQVQEAEKKAWNDFTVVFDEGDPSVEEISRLIAPYQSTLDELEQFKTCDDLTWDHRLRDVEGPEVYAFLLPELQEARKLARLLRHDALLKLKQKDFQGALDTVQTGYRFAAFVRSGETLVQQLVGVAIEGVMQSVVLEMIKTPGCPNLYWALASVPHSSQPMRRALELEFSTVERVLTVLKNAETTDWDQATWARKWQESVKQLEQLLSAAGGGGASMGLSVIVAVQISTGVDAAKDRLLRYGIAADKLDAMCPEQVIALDTVYQLREWGDRFTAEGYLPFSHAREIRKKNEAEFQQWCKSKHSLAALLAGLLYPAASAAASADDRIVAMHNRLMTIEAVRYYAATHKKQLPKSLELLEDLPAMIDPFTNKLIQYELANDKGADVGVFTIDVPNVPEELRTLRISIAE